MHGDGEVGRLLGALRCGGEGELVAGRRADELVVETFGDPALTDLVRPVLGVEAGDLLAVTRGRQVERDEVAGRGRPVDVVERTGAAQLALDHRVDLLVGGIGRRQFDAQPAVAGDGDLGTDLDRRVELDRTFLLAARDLDLRRGDDVDVVLADRLGEVLRDRVAQRLLARRADADARLEHPSRRLAVAEAGQPHLAGDGLERPVDVAIELVFLDLDVQLDLVPLEGFNRTLHRAASLSVGVATRPLAAVPAVRPGRAPRRRPHESDQARPRRPE